MVSRLMLNLRREALRRKPILDYRVTSQTGGGVDANQARFAIMSSAWALEPEDEYVTSSSTTKTFGNTLVGNLGASVTIWGEDDEEDDANEGEFGQQHSHSRNEVEMRAVPKKIHVQVTEEIVTDDCSRTLVDIPSGAAVAKV